MYVGIADVSPKGSSRYHARSSAIDTTSGFVADVPAGGRVYFETPVKRKAARYRVTITGWDWRDGGGQ